MTRLGRGPGAVLQSVVPAGEWQWAQPAPGPEGYALMACVVAPGFDFADFEMKQQVLEAVAAYRGWAGFDMRVGSHVNRAFLEVEAEAF